MTRTVTYARLHAAFADAAQALGTEPMVARVALAIAEDGGTARTDALEATLCCEPSSLRRALGRMYQQGLATGVAADSGPRRPGTRTLVRLTGKGRRLVAAVERALGEEVAA